MSNTVYLSDIRPRPRFFVELDLHRHPNLRWLFECFAEALGVFFYTYSGVGSQASFILGNILKASGDSSILQIGLAYGCGILFAIAVCSATSGGHFNPAITVTHLIFNRFPPLKALRYLIAQILGGYIACLLVYVQYKSLIAEAEAVLVAAGPGVSSAVWYTPTGPGGIFASSLPTGSDIGRTFVNEFMMDFMVAIVIFAVQDRSNIIPPTTGPMVIALAYAVAIWSYSVNGRAANAAHDLGGRLTAVTIWGTSAAGGPYAALAALTNIPATLLAFVMYEILLSDYDRVVPPASLAVINAQKNHRRRLGFRKQSPGSDTTLVMDDGEVLPR
ncbi:aquaporin-like protein [Mycena epipterygia]|nr:aquaporin-like protein [Mycena epipterygia]